MLYLASNSPRRKQLLTLGGWEFQAIPAEVDESALPGEKPAEYVLRLAKSKATAAVVPQKSGAIIIAADTTVACCDQEGDVIIGKPADAGEAEVILRQLRNRTHMVYTGLALLRLDDGALLTDLCSTAVPMRNYSDEEMTAYIATGDPLDKAGAYAIQHAGFRPVENLHGCYANVMGLPLCHLTRALASIGVHPQSDIPESCQADLNYRCPVYTQVLIN